MLPENNTTSTCHKYGFPVPDLIQQLYLKYQIDTDGNFHFINQLGRDYNGDDEVVNSVTFGSDTVAFPEPVSEEAAIECVEEHINSLTGILRAKRDILRAHCVLSVVTLSDSGQLTLGEEFSSNPDEDDEEEDDDDE